MRATTLARTGPASVSLDTVEEPEVAPEREDDEDVVVTFRGLRVPVSADAQILPLVAVTPKKR